MASITGLGRKLGLFIATLCLACTAHAVDVPESLLPWQAWVLKDNPSTVCPFLYNAAEARRCAWPSQLTISADATHATFSQTWKVYTDSWLTLPGDAQTWPTDVTANGNPAPVTLHEGLPSVYLTAGNYTLAGQLTWAKRPEAITVPKDSGLVELTVDGQAVTPVQLETNGRLWFGKNVAAQPVVVEENRVDVSVFRKLTDDIPLSMETRLVLDVSGDDRELVLGQFLLPHFKPVAMNSPLPARIEPDGRLRIQLRAGHWVVNLMARDDARSSEFKMVRLDELWPKDELWSFAQNRALRTVSIDGAQSIDPQQTKMPDEWKKLPTYLVTTENYLALKETFRGDPEPENNQLSLQRDIWLDFDGAGFTIKDHITGNINQSTRLSMLAAYDLGRATLNGQPQLITHLKNEKNSGIEVQRGGIDLVTLSRHARVSELNAVGWNHDFQNVNATLHLPPAWSLFNASGIDKVVNTWVSQWTLWAIFLVLIISVSIARLYSVPVGLLALVVLLMTYHENGAPIGLWLNVVIVMAVCKLIPESTFKKVLHYYGAASFVALFLVLLPFAVNHIREGIYPQLEHPWQVINANNAAAGYDAAMPANAPAADAVENLPAEGKVAALAKRADESVAMLSSVAPKDLQAGYDPKARIQTGPGEPAWQWNNVSLNWSGLVTASQTMSLTLWGPAANRALDFLRALLAFALAAQLMIASYGMPTRWKMAAHSSAKVLLPLVLVLLTLFHADNSRADFPPQQLLDDLKQRLLAPPTCLPECAAVGKTQIIIDEKSLAIYLTVDALDNVSIPVLSNASQWVPNAILVDGKAAEGIAQTDNQLFINVPSGRHTVVLQGSVAALQKLQLNFALPVKNVELKNQGWQVNGIVENRIPGGVEFSRISSEPVVPDKANTLLPDIFPAFVHVERHISLDVDWMMTTRVLRVAPEQGVISLKIPVVTGESIITEGVKTENGQVLVNMGANQPELQWQSILNKNSDIVLQAANSTDWVEEWYVASTPMWHVDTEGIAPIKSPYGLQWRPWPEEKITLHVQRPEASKGNTLTIENVRVDYRPGQRESVTTLSLQLLSSLGGNYGFDLPDGAKLQTIEIDGRNQSLPQTGKRVEFPIHPGSQKVSVTWQRVENMSAHTVTPTLNLKNELSNIDIVMQLPQDRWPLFVGGPAVGPAVLFWGLLLVIMLVAVALGKDKAMPVKTYQWVLLGLGMSTTTWPMMIIVVAWFFALSRRTHLSVAISNDKFNLAQVGIIFLTLLALSALFKTVQMSLLFSQPDMMITGNGSYAYDLHWYQDRMDGQLPSGWVMSLPMWAYRLAMLCWSLWLTFALMKWLRWGWQQFSTNGLWRKSSTVVMPSEPKKPESP